MITLYFVVECLTFPFEIIRSAGFALPEAMSQGDDSVVCRSSTSNKPIEVTLVENNPSPLGVQLVDPKAVAKVSDPNDLVELAKQIQKADEFVRSSACGRLTLIVDQIKYLQAKAHEILEEAKRDHGLHHAACNFKKIPGQVYFLYERASGQQYFSLLSSSEWGSNCPHRFLGAYRLENDMSWTPAENIAARNQDLHFVNAILDSQRTFPELSCTPANTEPSEPSKPLSVKGSSN